MLTEHRLVIFWGCLQWIVLTWQILHASSDLCCISMSFLLADKFLCRWGARIDRRRLIISRLYGGICTLSYCSTTMNTRSSLALLNSRWASRVTPCCRSIYRLRNTLILVLNLRFWCLSLWRLLCCLLLRSSYSLLFIVGRLTVLAF